MLPPCPAAAQIADIGTNPADAIRTAVQDPQGPVFNRSVVRMNQLAIVLVFLLPITFATAHFGMKLHSIDNLRQSEFAHLMLGVTRPVSLLLPGVL